MIGFLQWLRWRWERESFIRSASRDSDDARSEHHSPDPERRDLIKTLPTIAPYCRLAEYYFSFSQRFCPHYDQLLRSLARRHRHGIRNVLDVACGAGTLTIRLARSFESVFGFDISEEMVTQARRACADERRTRIALADFRDFRFAERFDAATCACDSLNYIERIEELAVVFARVTDHLRPGGFFTFDVLNAEAMRFSTTLDLERRDRSTRFAMCTEYDQWNRKETTYVAFRDGVEKHYRIPIEEYDVCEAATKEGLVVSDVFSDLHGFRTYYVLRVPDGR